MPANQDQSIQPSLEEQIQNLPTMSKEAILAFFKQDLSTVAYDKVIGNLKMVTMFMDVASVTELKKNLLEQLSPKNKQIIGLEEYLKAPVEQEILDQISVKEGGEELADQKPAVPMPARPQDYIQKSFPKNDHFDFADMQEVSQFRKSGTIYSGHSFEQVLSTAFAALPQEVKAGLEQDHLSKRRFESIIVTYLKDIRDEIETKQRLAARRALGGMELSHDVIEVVMKALDSGGKQTKPSIKKGAVLSPKPVDAKEIKELQQGDEVILAPLVQKPNHINIPIETEKEIIKKPSVPQPPVTLPRAPITKARSAPGNDKKSKMQDVKHPAKQPQPKESSKPSLVSPTEEFSHLCIDDIRRQKSPSDFVKDIIGKIDVLSQNNYANRKAAIDFWIKSPLHQAYLSAGRASLEKGVQLDEYLASTDKGLTDKEYLAISELNKQLRFY